jgi:hypothetical protein
VIPSLRSQAGPKPSARSAGNPPEDRVLIRMRRPALVSSVPQHSTQWTYRTSTARSRVCGSAGSGFDSPGVRAWLRQVRAPQPPTGGAGL